MIWKKYVNKLGFKRKQTHHQVYRLWLEGKLVARTYISHGERELSRFHVAQMAKQMRLNKTEFLDAINCPLTQKAYYHLLRERISGSGIE